MFIFGRCHRSSAAETPGEYECNLRYLNYKFAKLKFPVLDKLINGALVTPTSVQNTVLTDTKYGPAKSLITPELVAIPMCPMIGKSQLQGWKNKANLRDLKAATRL